jgi:hypothetical protein
VSDDKVIPFRKRSPSENELEAFRVMTRNWHPDMRRLMFPDHVEREHELNDKD